MNQTTAQDLPVIRRDQVDAREAGTLHRGGPWKADLRLVDVGGDLVVVKDFAGKPLPSRWLGRLQVAREAAAYRRLQGLEGVPRFFGRVDAWALAMERVEGELLVFWPRRRERAPRTLASLRRIVDGMHQRGVVHLDLRSRDNVLVRSDGSPVVIDFASAFCFRPGSLAHRWVFPRMAAVDEAAYLKWKVLLDQPLSDGERAAMERFERRRNLWLFNRAKLRKRKGGADAG